jgi:hypothetical protein
MTKKNEIVFESEGIRFDCGSLYNFFLSFSSESFFDAFEYDTFTSQQKDFNSTTKTTAN